MIDVILVEDHNVVRRGFKTIIEKNEDIRVVAEVENGKEALDYLANGNYADLMLTDVDMPVMGGLELATLVTMGYPTIKVIMLGAYDKEECISKAFKAGAKGYVLKNTSPDEVIFAIKHVNANNRYICAEMALRYVTGASAAGNKTEHLPDNDIIFSDREREVLNLISQGFTNQEIADKLVTSKHTVGGYRNSLLQKTGQSNSAALVKFAVIKGAIY